MFNIIESVLKRGNFELTDMLKKIDTFWVSGDLTDEQHASLIEFAQSKADPTVSIDIITKIQELEKRIQMLETGDITTDGETNTEEYPDYTVGKWYSAGVKITFEGKKYECVAPDGVVCVWSPSELPAYWQEVVEEV